MNKLSGHLTLLGCATALTLPMFLSSCTVHAGYYDPYYHDHHNRNGEVVYYGQWEHDTHRDHMDFDRRSDADKKAYWEWRHHHEDDHH
jgi:hypothetical protein